MKFYGKSGKSPFCSWDFLHQIKPQFSKVFSDGFWSSLPSVFRPSACDLNHPQLGQKKPWLKTHLSWWWVKSHTRYTNIANISADFKGNMEWKGCWFQNVCFWLSEVFRRTPWFFNRMTFFVFTLKNMHMGFTKLYGGLYKYRFRRNLKGLPGTT